MNIEKFKKEAKQKIDQVEIDFIRGYISSTEMARLLCKIAIEHGYKIGYSDGVEKGLYLAGVPKNQIGEWGIYEKESNDKKNS